MSTPHIQQHGSFCVVITVEVANGISAGVDTRQVDEPLTRRTVGKVGNCRNINGGGRCRGVISDARKIGLAGNAPKIKGLIENDRVNNRRTDCMLAFWLAPFWTSCKALSPWLCPKT